MDSWIFSHIITKQVPELVFFDITKDIQKKNEDVFVKSTTAHLPHLKTAEKRQFCLSALQKYIGLGHKMFRVYKGISPKVMMEFFPTEPTFKL